MKKNELISYVNDFLSLLYFKNDFLGRVNSIILFGSVARGDFDKNSDIDIFIDVKSGENIKEIDEIASSALNEFELKAREVWHIRKIKSPIKCIVGLLKDERWKELRKDIESYGLVFYGSFKASSEDLKSYSLFEYSLKDFNQKNRVALQRGLFGYKSKKGRKGYAQKERIDEICVIKLKDNNMLVPSKEALGLQKFFTKNKVTPKIKELWVRE